MGCDIHAVVRVKPKKGPPYVFTDVQIDRDYELFGILAGIRDNTAPNIQLPRGLPKDIRLIANRRNEIAVLLEKDGYTPELYWLGEHSFSHLPIKDILSFFNRRKKLARNHSEFIKTLKDIVAKAPGKVEELELIFGFDS